MTTRLLIAGLCALLAGCGQAASGPVAVEPVELTRDAACELDGMILMDYGGPKAQLLRKDGTRAFFCSADEIFGLLVDGVERNRIAGAWVQAVDSGDWTARAGAWVAADACHYVIGSKKEGAMGPTFAPFSNADAARAFAKENGGEVHAYGAIDAARVKAHRDAVAAALAREGGHHHHHGGSH